MDRFHARPGAQVSLLRESVAEAKPRQTRGEQTRNQILSGIISHRPLPSIMQMIADAFVAQCPDKAIAVFLRTGLEFHIEAEAGLPQRLPPTVVPLTGVPAPDVQTLGGRTARTRAAAPWESGNSSWMPVSTFGDNPGSGDPAFTRILDCGFRLCLATPLTSASGEASGAIVVFDTQQGLLDDAAHETIQSLCDLARLAIEHSRLYEEVVHRSQYDRLTGLPNRLLLEDRLQQAMLVARRQGTLIAICCIDLDRFKFINDSLGHELGDVFVRLVSERLNLSIREIDTLACDGGDEFIVALLDLAEISDALTICHRLLKDLAAPFRVGDHSLTVSAGIGISIFPDHGDTADQLLRNADLALQAAKRAGSSQTHVYSPAVGRESRRAAEMVDALVGAIGQAQFRMAYQPIYTMNREIEGFEALLRWKHPAWGQISPMEFIPLAEKSGLIVPIGDWVIDEVCRQATEWNAATLLPVKMFVNISGVQLERPDFSTKIAKALSRSGLQPERLELEITESWIISDLREAAGKLQKLRGLGIGIAIDDFGTGYSTFKYLQQLPLDTLKIDRSFIHHLDRSAANLSTVRAITALAQQLGLRTVAEGVESEENIRQLSEIGCELMQGFFLARPLKPQAAGSLLRKQSSAALHKAAAKRPLAEVLSR